MIDTDDLDNMSRRDLVELLEAYNESLAEVKRLRMKIAEVKIWMSLAPSVTQQTIDRLFPEDVIE